MSEKVKKLAPEIWQEIKKAKKILLHCHPNPDPDSMGSALGLMHLLKNAQKEVTVISGDSIPSAAMSAMPGFKDIVPKNIFKIDLNDFDLFIVLDSSALNQISKKGEIKFPPNLRTVKIDHHRNKDNFADINLIDTNYSSTCQMVYELAKLWRLKITPDAAACLLIGIYTDTGGFKYPPTNADTFLAASELAKIYPDYFKIIFHYENSVNPKQLEYLSLALSSIEHYFSGKVAISVIPHEELRKRGLNRSEISGLEIANTLKSVPGWIIGIELVESSPNMIEAHFRKREYEGPDLSKAAIVLGGGGHKSAAGAPINKPLNEAKALLLKTLKEVYPELGEI